MKSGKIKIYLDTNILDWTNKWILGKSSTPLPKKREHQIFALKTIYEKYSNYIIFCVSMHANSEIMNINDKKRHSDPKIISLLKTINLLKDEYQIDFQKKFSSIFVLGHSRLNMARLCDEEGLNAELYEKLKSRISIADAIHFVDAFDFEPDIFLTVDYSSIINKRDKIQEIIRNFIDISIYDPDECLSYLNSKFELKLIDKKREVNQL